ncbi:MAG: hypothetical protein ABH834_02535 [Candidatus Altiarchaeota archaeon]
MKSLIKHLIEVEEHVLDAFRGGRIDDLKGKVESVARKLGRAGGATQAGKIGELVYCQTDAEDVFVASTAFKDTEKEGKALMEYARMLPELSERFGFRGDDAEICMRKLVKHATCEEQGKDVLFGFVASRKGFLCSMTYWGDRINVLEGDALPINEIADLYEETPLDEGGETVGGKIIFALEAKS